MHLLQPRRRLSRRSLPVLMAGIIGGAAVLTPAVGSAAAFLTKAKGNRRYLQNSSIVGQTATVPANSGATLTVSCPAGLQALSGGADTPFTPGPSSSQGMVLQESKPTPSSGRPTGWHVEVFTLSSPTPVTVYAVCSR